jgi:hypothetical protein
VQERRKEKVTLSKILNMKKLLQIAATSPIGDIQSSFKAFVFVVTASDNCFSHGQQVRKSDDLSDEGNRIGSRALPI